MPPKKRASARKSKQLRRERYEKDKQGKSAHVSNDDELDETVNQANSNDATNPQNMEQQIDSAQVENAGCANTPVNKKAKNKLTNSKKGKSSASASKSRESTSVDDVSVADASLETKITEVDVEPESDSQPSCSTSNNSRKAYYKYRYDNDPDYRKRKQNQKNAKYAHNPQFRESEKKRKVNAYAESPQNKEKARNRSRQKYSENPQHRESVRKQSRQKYAENLQHRESVKKQSRLKYAEYPEHRETVRKQSRQKYAENPQHRETVRKQSRQKYAENPQHRETVRKQSRQKYTENPQHRETVRKQSRQKYSENPQHRDKVKQLSRQKYAHNERHRQRVIAYNKLKYAHSESYRNKLKKQATIRYRTIEHYRTRKNILLARKIKQRYANDDQFRLRTKAMKRKLYAEQSDEKKQEAKRRRIENTRNKTDMDKVIKSFKAAIKDGPEHTCSVCHRLCFKSQVEVCKPEKFTKKPEVATQCIDTSLLHTCTETCERDCVTKKGPLGKLWICTTCKTHVSRGAIPCEARENNLTPEEVPEQLAGINSLEENLIAKTISFARIINLPCGSQPGVKGPTICVPSDIKTTTNVLPRPLSESDIIPVKLKRKVHYKGHVNFKMVRTAKVKAALSWLRANNPRYRDVTLNEHWDEHTEDDTLQDIIDRQDENTTHEADSDDTANEMQIPTTSDTQDMSVDNEDTHAETQPMTATNDTLDDEANRDDATEPDNENDADFDERDQLHGVANDTCLQPIEFTSQALSQLHDAIFSIAPAEGNRPVSLMSNDDDQDTEATTFPGLFPTGKGTFKSERLTKLTLSKYLNARLLGSDLRFAQNTQYIFFAQYAKELEQLLSGITYCHEER